MANEPIRLKVETRRTELEKTLAALPADDARSRLDIENALRALSRLMTGDLDNIPSPVAKELAKWLDTSKYLGQRQA